MNNSLDMTNTEFFKVSQHEEFQQQLINTNNGFNGRVFLQQHTPTTPNFELYKNANTAHYLGNRLQNQMETTPLADAFFSKENVDNLQNIIRNHVQVKAQSDPEFPEEHKPVLIARQNDTELYIIMRSIYLQYGRNLDSDIAGQVNSLNILVSNEATPKIISALKQKIQYLYDIEHLPIPLERAQNISNAGEKFGDISRIFHGRPSGKFNLF
jgi:hypothetical protein